MDLEQDIPPKLQQIFSQFPGKYKTTHEFDYLELGDRTAFFDPKLTTTGTSTITYEAHLSAQTGRTQFVEHTRFRVPTSFYQSGIIDRIRMFVPRDDCIEAHFLTAGQDGVQLKINLQRSNDDWTVVGCLQPVFVRGDGEGKWAAFGLEFSLPGDEWVATLAYRMSWRGESGEVVRYVRVPVVEEK